MSEPTRPAPSMRRPHLRVPGATARRRLVPAVAVGVAAAMLQTGHAASPSMEARSAHTTAIPMCGVADPASGEAPQSALDQTKPTAVTPATSVADVQVQGGLLYVLDAGKNRVDVYRTDGTLLRTVSVGWKRTSNSLGVGPDGSIYLQRYPYEVVKVNALGQPAWSVKLPDPVNAVFTAKTGAGWVVGAVTTKGTRLFDQSGRAAGTAAVSGSRFTTAPDGTLVATDGRQVRTYDADLKPGFHFGGGGSQNKPAAGEFDFYLLGSAAKLSDGRYLVADGGRGLELFDPHGILLGTVPGSDLALTEASAVQVIGKTVYVTSGKQFSASQQVVSLPLSDVLTMATQPGPDAGVLGIGAGLRIDAAGAYFPTGTAPKVTAVFDPWWQQLSGVTLSYTVRSRDQVESRAAGLHRSVKLDAKSVSSGVALALPSAAPGPYQIDARLMQGSRTLSAQCSFYAVGSPADTLNLDNLPGSYNSGGPDGPRNVALAEVFGTGGARIQLDWRKLMPDGTAGPLDFSAYDAEIAAAAKEAARNGVKLSVQVGQGGPERQLVDNGTWRARVAQIVAHYRGEVHYWEAWNEPNATFGPAKDYVQKVLQPFYSAVKTTDPTAKVIGGTVVGMDLGYWKGIADAGGFRSMDIAGIHPYTGHNRSFEEQDFPVAYGQLRQLMKQYGAANMPAWVTELAWWSNGPANVFAQADRTARAQLWLHALGIPVWDYFIAQGSWGNDGTTFSLIQDGSVVKPSALAAMTQRAETAGRSFTGWLHTGIPGAYAARFGPSSNDSGSVVALWTDDESMPATISLDGNRSAKLRVDDEFGGQHTVTLDPSAPLRMHSAVQYVHVPAGSSLVVAPTETFGPDLALATDHAKASATSSKQRNAPSGAIDGDDTAGNVGNIAGAPAWASGYDDGAPELTVTLAKAQRVDRVQLWTSSVSSVLPGVRSWTVQVRDGSGWRTVGARANLFYDRSAVVSFAPVTTDAIRIRVDAVNFGGYAGGAQPWFWPKSSAHAAKDPNDISYGPAIVREISVYAPGR